MVTMSRLKLLIPNILWSTGTSRIRRVRIRHVSVSVSDTTFMITLNYVIFPNYYWCRCVRCPCRCPFFIAWFPFMFLFFRCTSTTRAWQLKTFSSLDHWILISFISNFLQISLTGLAARCSLMITQKIFDLPNNILHHKRWIFVALTK
jgi:hypothetical protein